MSHYIYRSKLIVEVPDGRILPLAYYSDSSIWSSDNRSHPAWWCLNTLSCKNFLVKKDDYKKAATAEYNHQIECLESYQEKFHPDKKESVGPESYHYSGNTYPGGGKLKNMRAFHSVRKTVPLEEFVKEHRCAYVTLEALKPNSWDGYEKVSINLTDEQAFLDAEQTYIGFYKKYPDMRGVCIGVYGM